TRPGRATRSRARCRVLAALRRRVLAADRVACGVRTAERGSRGTLLLTSTRVRSRIAHRSRRTADLVRRRPAALRGVAAVRCAGRGGSTGHQARRNALTGTRVAPRARRTAGEVRRTTRHAAARLTDVRVAAER